MGKVRGDHTTHSAVRICRCGARFVGLTVDDVLAQLRTHEQRGGCGTSARNALDDRRRKHRHG